MKPISNWNDLLYWHLFIKKEVAGLLGLFDKKWGMSLTVKLVVIFSIWIFGHSAIATEADIEVLRVNSMGVAKALLVLFPGGRGKIYKSNSSKELNNNFLVRTYHDLSKFGYNVVVIGKKKGSMGYDDKYRLSQSHVEEVEAVISKFNNKRLPVFLLGTSRGTISAANIAARDKGLEIKGVVLTATVAKNPRLQETKIYMKEIPSLFIHHAKDKCWVSSLEDTLLFSKKFVNQNQVYFESIVGGNKPKAKPCRALSYHGFYGAEKQVLIKIDEWIQGVLKP